MKVLFVGNSHTYNNEVPLIFLELASQDKMEASAVMNAHGGWTLYQHSKEPDVPFNICHGGFDYVVFQEHAHPFDHDGNMTQACEKMAKMCYDAGSTPVYFMVWPQKWERERQDIYTEGTNRVAKLTGGLVAPVGVKLWEAIDANPDVEYFSPDGGHLSPEGSLLAAKIIWQTIKDHYLANK